MRTDWALVRRLAFELDARLRGGRVQDAGILSDGRPAIEFWARGPVTLAMDLFGSTPVVTLEGGELEANDAPGFTRTFARTLRGAVVEVVRAREHDRLLALNLRTHSRFGVGDEVDLSIELVPRFGNAVLVKNGVVVAALKEFVPTRGGRTIRAGFPYEPPPLQARALPRLVEESAGDAGKAWLQLEGERALREPLYVYRRDGVLVQPHLLALSQFADATLSREDSLLDILAEDRRNRAGSAQASRVSGRRAALERRLTSLLRRTQTAIAALAARDDEIATRDELRTEGERIYATLHDLDADAQAVEKARAAKIFARYRKLTTAAGHTGARRQALEMQSEALEALLWELQRAGDAEIDDVEATFATLERPARSSPKTRKKLRRRPPLLVTTASGSRILVGRSPLENADLTFRVARPNDLWFHARGVPGAHVILARDDRSLPPDEDVEHAASLAAGHSKARESAKVEVDYTLRKHVRKRPDAPPGLVFYTNARSIAVEPERD